MKKASAILLLMLTSVFSNGVHAHILVGAETLVDIQTHRQARIIGILSLWIVGSLPAFHST